MLKFVDPCSTIIKNVLKGDNDMIFKFPDTIVDEKEEYITLIPLKKFVEDYELKGIRKSMHRGVILQGIEKFANEGEPQKEIVEEWLDNSIKCGRKEVYLHFIEETLFDINALKDVRLVEEKLKEYMENNRHLLGNQYDENLKLYKYELNTNKNGTIITLHFCKMIYSINSKGEELARWYPIIIEIYIDKCIMAAKVKQKSSMYIYQRGDIAVKNLPTTTPEKEAKAAMHFTAKLLGVSLNGNSYADSDKFKERLYRFVSKYTETPNEILKELEEQALFIDKIVKDFKSKVINLPPELCNDLETDVRNMFEKYLSITKTDYSIFIKDEKAYPFRLIAADEEESKVDQAAVAFKPLQSKSIFFDNKKMLLKNKKCDGVFFSILKKDAKSISDDRFILKIKVKNGYCNLSWNEYLTEDDVDYAIFSVINA